jgi:hypothetical protein
MTPLSRKAVLNLFFPICVAPSPTRSHSTRFEDISLSPPSTFASRFLFPLNTLVISLCEHVFCEQQHLDKTQSLYHNQYAFIRHCRCAPFSTPVRQGSNLHCLQSFDQQYVFSQEQRNNTDILQLPALLTPLWEAPSSPTSQRQAPTGPLLMEPLSPTPMLEPTS